MWISQVLHKLCGILTNHFPTKNRKETIPPFHLYNMISFPIPQTVLSYILEIKYTLKSFSSIRKAVKKYKGFLGNCI